MVWSLPKLGLFAALSFRWAVELVRAVHSPTTSLISVFFDVFIWAAWTTPDTMSCSYFR